MMRLLLFRRNISKDVSVAPEILADYSRWRPVTLARTGQKNMLLIF